MRTEQLRAQVHARGQLARAEWVEVLKGFCARPASGGPLFTSRTYDVKDGALIVAPRIVERSPNLPVTRIRRPTWGHVV